MFCFTKGEKQLSFKSKMTGFCHGKLGVTVILNGNPCASIDLNFTHTHDIKVTVKL